MHLFSQFFSVDIPEWMILEQVDDCEQLSIFLNTEKLNVFSLGKDYLEFFAKYPRRRKRRERNPLQLGHVKGIGSSMGMHPCNGEVGVYGVGDSTRQELPAEVRA